MNKAQMLELIAKHVTEILPDTESHTFVELDRLVDLGANSVDRVEITMLVQEPLSVPRVELFGPRNVGELADLFLKNPPLRISRQGGHPLFGGGVGKQT
jgi:polyketide biosynthesis acyl carrier protein